VKDFVAAWNKVMNLDRYDLDRHDLDRHDLDRHDLHRQHVA